MKRDYSRRNGLLKKITDHICLVNKTTEHKLVFGHIVCLSSESIFKNRLNKIICNKIQSCFLDLTFIFKLYLTNFYGAPVS